MLISLSRPTSIYQLIAEVIIIIIIIIIIIFKNRANRNSL